jgi:hypothetical protein
VLLSVVLPLAVLGGLLVTAIIVFLKNLRSEDAHAIPWRRLAVWGLWGLAAYIIIFIFGDRVASFLNAYDTAIPLKTMLAGLGIGSVIGAVVYFAGITLLFGVAWYFAKRAFGGERLPGWTGMPGTYYRDALWMGVGGTAALIGLSRISAVVTAHWPTAHRAVEAAFGGDYDAKLPVAAIFGEVLLRALMYTGMVAVVASFVAIYVKPLWRRLLLFAGAALALVGSSWGTPADFVKQFLAGAVVLAVLIFGVTRIVRFNMLGYFLVAAGTSLLGGAVKLISQPDGFYRWNGYAVLVGLAALMAWPLVAWQTTRQSIVSTN